MSLKRIGFQIQRNIFFETKHINLAVFPRIGLKASNFTDNRQKTSKKTFLLIKSNIGIHDFVKIRRTFIAVLYLLLNLIYIYA